LAKRGRLDGLLDGIRNRLAVEFLQLWLVIKGVDVDGPPTMKRKITDFALAAKWDGRGAKGFSESISCR